MDSGASAPLFCEVNMRIRILKNTVANKRPVKIGQVVEVPDNEGKFLVSIGKAKHEAKQEPEPKAEPESEPKPDPIHEAPKRRKFEGKK